MKTVVCTLTVGEFFDKLAEKSHPTFKAYADKIGADFVVRRESKYKIVGYEKFDFVKELLNTYDRVCFVDTDILIRFDAPNIFDVVPYTYFGAFNEGDLFPERVGAKKNWFKQMELEEDPVWANHRIYFNTGVFVVSKYHQDLFYPCEKQVGNFAEQTTLNYRVYESGTPIFQLPYRFNRLTATIKVSGEIFDDSYFAHFAGAFLNNETKDQNLKAWDAIAKRFAKYKANGKVPEFRRRIYIQAGAALGDEVSVEPVIRFIREEIAPDAEITIRANFPEIYSHLLEHPSPTAIVGIKHELQNSGQINISLFPHPQIINFNLMHPLDYAAITAFRGTLPSDKKGIKLVPKAKSPIDVKDKIVVHCGKSWQSKTFPLAWWQEVIGLLQKHATVVLIGKTYPEHDFRGTVAVEAPQSCIDLRDKTNLQELIALLSEAGMLVSNDSSPVHIAGAFKTPIAMVATAKSAEFIWPYRDTSLNLTFGGRIHASRPVLGIINNTFIHECPMEELASLLPSPEELVEKSIELFRRHQ